MTGPYSMSNPDVAVFTTPTMTANSASIPAYLDGLSVQPDARAIPRSLKKHKALPHPQVGRHASSDSLQQSPDTLDTARGSPASSSRYEGTADRLNGVGLPPTPPGPSRSSSSSNSALPSSPTYVASPLQSDSSIIVRSSGTPPNQKSPPTPDVTPPARDTRRPKAVRPSLTDRIPSKATTDSRGGSRTASFITAQEFPCDSDDDERSTLKATSSAGARTPQNTGRRELRTQIREGQGGVSLGSGVETDENLTPRTRQDFSAFDGDWASPQGEVEQEWDDNLNRNVMVRQRKPRINGNRAHEVIQEATSTPPNATKPLRSLPVQERPRVQSGPVASGSKTKRASIPATSETAASTDAKRSSVMSSKSGTSTAVEVVLVDSPPRRQRTLRHVKKQISLRDSVVDVSPASSATLTTNLADGARQSRPPLRPLHPRAESIASTTTVNSISSRKARREVWKNGGIPVVVIPDRNASTKSNKAPSLRSTSSHRTRRSNSLSSAQGPSRTKDVASCSDTQHARRPRSMSASSNSFVADQLTMDYPPIVPRRTSSISAPTSRNVSRAGSMVGSPTGSLTAESLRAHNAIQRENYSATLPPKIVVEPRPSIETLGTANTRINLQPVQSRESQKSATEHRATTDANGDPFFGNRLTTFATPFSQASVETAGTGTVTHSIADVSEARVVNIFPHQNKSVLMVHHKSRPLDGIIAQDQAQSSGDNEGIRPGHIPQGRPVVKIPNSGQDDPVTPTQIPQIRMDDVDSPLRNPRDPPALPAIHLTPATPSGLTPAHEHEDTMREGYFPGTSGRPSLVRRALGLRRTPDNGTPRRVSLLRALSISRNIRRDTAENPDLVRSGRSSRYQYPTADDPPSDDSKLHPFWRPVSEALDDEDESSDEEGWRYNLPDDVDQVYVYPAARSRPAPRRRDSLTARLKHTFSILPIEDDRHYTMDDARDTDRRTIKRTPSGNLRVMRYPDNHVPDPLPVSRSLSRRWSVSSWKSRPSTAPDDVGQRSWGNGKQVDDRGRRVFPGWQEKLEQMRPGNLQRRLTEHRRQKRTDVLRQKISGPREVRDGVGDVIKRNSYKGPSYQKQRQPQTEKEEEYNDKFRGEVWDGRQI